MSERQVMTLTEAKERIAKAWGCEAGEVDLETIHGKIDDDWYASADGSDAGTSDTVSVGWFPTESDALSALVRACKAVAKGDDDE